MTKINKALLVAAIIASAFSLKYLFGVQAPTSVKEAILGATTSTYSRNFFPDTTSVYWNGTSTKSWAGIYTDKLCLLGDCQTVWPTGGGGGNNFFSATSSFVRPLSVTDGVTTSTLSANSLSVASSTTNGAGLFYVDGSGNVSASGTLGVTGISTQAGILNTASSTFLKGLNIAGNPLNVSSTPIIASLV